MTDPEDLTYERAAARIARITAALGGTGTAVALAGWGWRAGAGFLIGSLLSGVQYVWLKGLVDALGGDMMMVSNELEKLILYVGEKKKITLGDVETMVLAAKQRSLYELTDAISAKDRVRALEVLDALLSTGDGEEAAIGHLYMLAKTFRQMLVILERNVRDQRMLWAALWQGFRVPPFAADDIIRQARRYKSKRELTRSIRLVAKADLALRSNPPGKRLILERLVLDLAGEAKVESAGGWMQDELPV